MEILGIGPSELIFIILIALIVLGPKDMQKTGKTIGVWLNKMMKSDGWKVFQRTSRELRNLPTSLMREANIDLLKTEKDIRRSMDPRPNPPASSPSRSLPPSEEAENSIQPSANPHAQAAVPGGESSAEDGAGSKDGAESASENASDQHD